MATTTEHIRARDDDDLTARLIASAEQAGITNADQWVGQHRGQLISVGVSLEGQCIADVHAYAATMRDQAVAALPPPPGADPAAVLDSYLQIAVETVRDQGNTA